MSSGPEGPAVACYNLYVLYGKEVILRDVTFEAPKGVFCPLVGPNGSGKTTLLKALLGLVRPNQGRISTPFHRNPPGYVPQHAAIDPLVPVSLRDIVCMGLYPKLGWWKRPGVEGQQTVSQVMDQFGLIGHEDKRFLELSGGMRQKTLIARALVNDPDVLLLDEPTAGLDENSQDEILEHLRRINVEQGKTILMAHHGEGLLTEIVDRVWEVGQGSVRSRGVRHV